MCSISRDPWRFHTHLDSPRPDEVRTVRTWGTNHPRAPPPSGQIRPKSQAQHLANHTFVHRSHRTWPESRQEGATHTPRRQIARLAATQEAVGEFGAA